MSCWPPTCWSAAATNHGPHACRGNRSRSSRSPSATARRCSGSAEAGLQLGELCRIDRIGVLGAGVAPRANVLGVGGYAGVHVLLEVGVALDKARAQPVADAEQVVG